MKWLLLSALLAGCAHTSAERPTQTGDVIGSATLDADSIISVSLRSVECDGAIVHGAWQVRPTDAGYRPSLSQYGLTRPGETKPVRAGKTDPCPER